MSRRSNRSVYVIKYPSPQVMPPKEYDVGWRRLRTAQKALRGAVRRSAARCRRSHGRAGVIRHSANCYEIRIGGRQGYHIWKSVVLGAPLEGTRVLRVIEN